MRLTALGVYGPYPAPGGACSGYFVESDSGRTRILLDCGPGALAQLYLYTEPNTLNAIVLSHLHYDHMSDLLAMQYALSKNPPAHNIPVIAPETPENVRALLVHPSLDLFRPQDFAVGEARLRFTPAVHPVEAVSIEIICDGARLVYTGDTNENPALELFADGCDMLLADAGVSEAEWSPKAPHLSALRCAKIAKAARVGTLILTHRNPKDRPDAMLDEARAVYPAAQIANVGDRWYC